MFRFWWWLIKSHTESLDLGSKPKLGSSSITTYLKQTKINIVKKTELSLFIDIRAWFVKYKPLFGANRIKFITQFYLDLMIFVMTFESSINVFIKLLN